MSPPQVAYFAVVATGDIDTVFVANQFGTVYKVTYGVGCFSFDLRAGAVVTITGASTNFIPIGSTLILSNGDSCNVFGAMQQS